MLDDTATVCLRGSRMSRPNTGVCDCVLRGARWWVGSRVRTLLLSWLSRLGDPGAPRRPQRPQRPGRSNESTGPQAVRTPALVNEH